MEKPLELHKSQSVVRRKRVCKIKYRNSIEEVLYPSIENLNKIIEGYYDKCVELHNHNIKVFKEIEEKKREEKTYDIKEKTNKDNNKQDNDIPNKEKEEEQNGIVKKKRHYKSKYIYTYIIYIIY